MNAATIRRMTVGTAAATGVAAYDAGRARNLRNAILSTETGIDRYAMASNPYAASLAGLGDWQDIVNTFVSEVGKGVASKISGKPTNQTIIQTPPPSALPSWAIPAAIGGGGLVLFLLLRRR